MFFDPVNPDQEKSILAQTTKKPKKGDTSVRTVTKWFTHVHHMGFCTVPTHTDNVMDGFDKYPVRMVMTIGDYEVCRWCFIAEADLIAALAGMPPKEDDGTN